MRVAASAPGKLVVLGEYAVLEGAPALVLAVDRRVHVSITTPSGDAWEIVSPTLGLGARLRIAAGAPVWEGDVVPELEWVAILVGSVPFAAQLPPCRVELDSGSFHLEQAGVPAKLGLGSSAALTVALLGALHALAGQPAPTLDACARIHRTIQRGRGSGIDVAASYHGGLLCFRLDAGRGPHCRALALPEGLRWCCVYSGRPASTRAMLEAIAAWRGREPARHARHMAELATIASHGVEAVAGNDAAGFLSSCQAYALALARFGEATGVDIASRAHRGLGAIAAACGGIYKSCGAGGGDVGITFAVDDVRLRDFVAGATQAGFPVLGLDADPVGLQVDVKT